MSMALGLLTKQVAKTPSTAKGRSEPDDLYEMANLFPDDTGLPVTVWVSPRGRARHAARIKVCRTAGNKMVPTNPVCGAGCQMGRVQPGGPAGVLGWRDWHRCAAA